MKGKRAGRVSWLGELWNGNVLWSIEGDDLLELKAIVERYLGLLPIFRVILCYIASDQ